jgi:hypothetical protein
MKRSCNPDIFEAYATPEEKRWDQISAAHEENRCVDDCPICKEHELCDRPGGPRTKMKRAMDDR